MKGNLTIKAFQFVMLGLKDIFYHPATSQEPILKNISLIAQQGIPLMISGPSGSGKTSLIEIISGLSKPQKGVITFQGQQIKARQRRSLSGVVFQFPERHFIGLNILQELRLGHRRLKHEKVLEVLNKVGLSDINMKQPPEELSGGQQRRLAIAVQLTRNPKILLLDEPTAGLDWSIKDEIISLIKHISSKIVLIVVTHEPQIFKEIGISSYELSNGNIKKFSLPKDFNQNL